MKRIISLGAGVQSSTLALMAANGELPLPLVWSKHYRDKINELGGGEIGEQRLIEALKTLKPDIDIDKECKHNDIDCAIFADTGAEPAHVYAYLDWLETQLPFPVYRVKHQNGLLANIMAKNLHGNKTERFVSVPFFTDFANGGMIRRQCTREFKIQPIQKKTRELVGLKKYQRAPKSVILVECLIGISTDEATRMKDSGVSWIQNLWPLIELRMRRSDCIEWLKSKGYRLPQKSACTFCPYHDDWTWRDMKDNDPEGWQQAVTVDRHLRSGDANCATSDMKGELYLHKSLKPLEEVDLSTAEERGQPNLFENECEGLCGV